MQDNIKTCAECGKEIEPLTEFPSRDGRGVVCMPCYERRMSGAQLPTAQEIAAMFRGSVTL